MMEAPTEMVSSGENRGQSKISPDNGSIFNWGALMIHQLDWRELRGRDFVPQRLIGRPPAYFADASNIQFSRGEDDLYYFEGALLRLDDGIDFILKRYLRDVEEGKTTIYLPHEINDIRDITEALNSIMRELGISETDILWSKEGSSEPE